MFFTAKFSGYAFSGKRESLVTRVDIRGVITFRVDLCLFLRVKIFCVDKFQQIEITRLCNEQKGYSFKGGQGAFR